MNKFDQYVNIVTEGYLPYSLVVTHAALSDPIIELELVRYNLQQYEKQGRMAPEIKNALSNIESAILYIQHYDERRALDFNTRALPVPESVEYNMHLIANKSKCDVILAFCVDYDYRRKEPFYTFELKDVYLQQVIPFFYTWSVFVSNDTKPNYIIEDIDSDKPIVTFDMSFVDFPDVLTPDSAYEYFKSITVGEYNNDLHFVNIASKEVYKVALPQYSIKHNAAYSPQKAFTFVRNLISILNDKRNINIVGAYDLMDVVGFFDNEFDDSDLENLQKAVKEADEKTSALPIKINLQGNY